MLDREDHMGKFILQRCLFMIVVMIGAAFVIFTILYFTPGDPATLQLGTDASKEEIAALSAKLGTDKPYLEQLGTFMYNLFIKLDFGISWRLGKSVMGEFWERLPRTLIIGLFSMVLNMVIGIPLGIFSALNEGKWQDSVVMTITMIFVSAPAFWVALMMIILFALKLQWLPAYGVGSWVCYIMPIITSAIGPIAFNARQTRSSMLEVFRADYITTARSKGQKENVIVWRHMLPNALMPIITVIGGAFSSIIAGSPIIESVFSIPGVGAYLLHGINNRDYPIVRGCVVFFAFFTALCMLLVDLAYAFVDPRIKAQYSAGGRKKVR